MTRARRVHTFEQVVVIGGGCYGSWYATQLARAAEAGALHAKRVVVVDRDAECRVAVGLRDHAFRALPVELVVASWADFLDGWLGTGEAALAGHALVPSPLMPHVLLDWLVARAAERWPAHRVRIEPLATTPRMPWERAAPDGRHYVSFAEWMCPINCIEPALCPATGGPRSWSMPPAVRAYVNALPDTEVVRGPLLFQCEHRTHGVGMIDADCIARADDAVRAWGEAHRAGDAAQAGPDGPPLTEPLRVLVGTVSHCHGALGMLVVR